MKIRLILLVNLMITPIASAEKFDSKVSGLAHAEGGSSSQVESQRKAAEACIDKRFKSLGFSIFQRNEILSATAWCELGTYRCYQGSPGPCSKHCKGTATGKIEIQLQREEAMSDAESAEAKEIIEACMDNNGIKAFRLEFKSY